MYCTALDLESQNKLHIDKHFSNINNFYQA